MHPTDTETIERYRAELAQIEDRRKVILGVLRALRANPRPPVSRRIVPITSATGAAGGGLVKAAQGMFVQVQPGTLMEAAEKALRSAGKPLSMPELIRAIQALGYRAGEDRKRLRNTLAPALKRRHAKKDLFANRDGKYVLLEWEK